MMRTFSTSDVAGTLEAARALARLLAAGDTVLLCGDLGAGKTQFTKALAEYLGIKEPVTSPTFSILSVYEGEDFPLFHFDLYRLDREDQLDDVGFWEALEGGGVSIVEWGDKFAGVLASDNLRIDITITGETSRDFHVVATGERASQLASDWMEAVFP